MTTAAQTGWVARILLRRTSRGTSDVPSGDSANCDTPGERTNDTRRHKMAEPHTRFGSEDYVVAVDVVVPRSERVPR